ncbi:hypothetical protein M0R89_01470 [Halorussus limi]|uniref:Uncharacterized protein n=1 Tax=Halorussus limi TaxID=2938695 RepID=A0A8U0HUI7_9EURY|nr:hypothetical protein [Halorussus limi]UPV74755.1 hypothetical protein M0R89_01470 [Halorussus limi]
MAMKQLRSHLDETGARTALVRDARAPPRPPETVTVAPGISGSVGPGVRTSPLYVTAEAPSGRTIREYDGRNVRAVAECATELVVERDPRAVWLCGRDQIRAWWGRGIADMLERRLAAAARRADARLVVWTSDGADDDASEDGDTAVEDDVAVEDGYDVVLDP